MEYKKGFPKKEEVMQCPKCKAREFFVYSVELRKHPYNSETKEWGLSEPVEWMGEYNDSVVCQSCGREITEQLWKLG